MPPKTRVPPCTAMPFMIAPMPCSRMPKWSTRPSCGSPLHSLVERSTGRNDGTSSMVVLLDSARSAEPPHSSGSTGRDRVDACCRRPCGSPSPSRRRRTSAARRPSRRAGSGSASGRRGPSGPRRRPPTPRTPRPRRPARPCPAPTSLPGVLDDLRVDVEGQRRVEAQHLLGGRHLVGAECRTVRLPGVLGVGRRPGDDRAEPDEAGLVGDRLGGLDRGVQRGDVLAVLLAAVGPVDVLHVPAVRRVAGRDVLGERDVGVVLDRDLVVVVDQREVAELLDAGDRRGLGRHALLDVAVAAQRVDVVVERRRAGARVEQAALATGGHGHAHGVADALAQRAGRGLDTGGVAVLRVARGLAAPGAQRLEVLELQPPAAEEELDVERQARVAARQHEPVAARPVRVGGVVPHHLLEEQVRRGREAHRGAGVAVADLLDGVHGEHPDGVHGLVVELVPVQVGCGAHCTPSTSG